jgi:quercetin dioxygenase-like cupin family protein
MSEIYRIERWAQVYAPNPAMLRFTMEREGFRVFQWGDRPEMIYGLHKHDEDQTHWIISGALELTVEKVGVFILEAGDRDFMPAGTYHTARVVSAEAVVYLIGEKIK